MIPILFSESSNTFTSNGIGRLSDVISCEVTEERNGQYELQMTYPSTGAHFDDIKLRAIIVAKPSAGTNNQPFRIYNISKPINGKVTINAQHISYDLSKNVSMPFSVTASSSACNQALQGLLSNAVETCPFTFSTDVTTVAPYNQKAPASIRQRLGGVEGSILDQFHGEYEFDVYDVKFWKDRGETKNIPLRYGKNITDIKQEEEISNTITGIVPFWMDNDGNNLVTLPEEVVYSPNASSYPQKLTVPMDFSADYENQPTEAQLRAHAQAYVNQSGIGVPKVSIDVSFVNLADTEEYKDILALQNVNLCDTIPVQFEPLGISTTAKIVKTEYDVLSEKYKKLTVGSLRSNLATAITEQNNAIVTETSAKFSKVTDQIDNATAWLTSADGYVIAVKAQDGTWKELIFADHQDPADWVHCLRINENGIGFSSDGGQTYTQAWTLDGRLVIGGTDVPSITVYDSNNNIIFKADATAMIWNATNSNMDANGIITMNGAQINGGKISIPRGGGYNETLEIETGRITCKDGNETSIIDNFSSSSEGSIITISNNAGGIDLQVKNGNNVVNGYRFLQDDVYIYKNNTVYEAADGTYVKSLSTDMKIFVDDVTPYTDTIYNVCTDLDIDFNNQTASWNKYTIEYVYSVGVTTDSVYGVDDYETGNVRRGLCSIN